MYLKINLQILLKDRPKGHLGLREARYQVDRPGPLGEQLYGAVKAICETALDMGIIESDTVLQQQLTKLRTFTKSLRLETQRRRS